MNSINKNIKREKAVKKLVDDIFDQIPPWPKIIEELMPLLRDMAPIKEISAVIVRDPGISAAVLTLARSSYYCRRAKIESIDDAVIRLGQRQLLEVCTLAGAAKVLSGQSLEMYGIKSGFLYNHSLYTALILQDLAHVFNLGKPLAAYTAGLLHDIGKIVLARKITMEQHQKITEEYIAGKPDLSLCDVERNVLGMNHAEVGAELARRWDLPEMVVDVIHWHDTPLEANSRWISMICLTYAASKLAIAHDKGEIPDYLQDYPVMIRLKINNEKAGKLISRLSKKLNSMKIPC